MVIGSYKNMNYFLKFYINAIKSLFLQLAFEISIIFKIYSFGLRSNSLILIAFLYMYVCIIYSLSSWDTI